MFRKLKAFFSSLQLAVACLAAAMVLIVFGTLAQTKVGIWEAQEMYFKTFFVWIDVGSGGMKLPIFPGGQLLCLVLILNLTVAHFVRFRMTWEKSGIFLAHFGLIVLLAGSLFTDFLSVESQMVLPEGGTKNYTEDFHHRELAVVETTHPQHDEVISIPVSLLKSKTSISHPKLPFTLKTLRYLPNSRIAQRTSGGGEAEAVTKGYGNKAFLQEARETFKQDEENVISAIVQIGTPETGETLGVWLFTNWFRTPQELKIGDRTFQITLRKTRHYLPYTIHLKKFDHDYYPGTSIPRNYSSLIRLKDEKKNEDRDVLIYMNHPLRYDGNTYYQQSFAQGGKISMLQVVRNPSWRMPYIACSLIALGLLVQFGIHLVRFAARGRKKKAESKEALSWVVGILATAYLLILSFSSHSNPNGMDLEAFGSLPVLSDGRIKPLDSVARNSLVMMRERQSVRLEKGKLTPTEWLADVLMRPEKADTYPVFAIHHPDLTDLLPDHKPNQKYFSFEELKPSFPEIQRQATLAGREEAQLRNPFQREVLELHRNLMLYRSLTYSLRPPNDEDFAKQLESFQELLQPGLEAFRLRQEGKPHDEKILERFARQVFQYQLMEEQAKLRPIPFSTTQRADDWESIGSAMERVIRTDLMDPVVQEYAKLSTAYRNEEAGTFNSGVTKLTSMYENVAPKALQKSHYEQIFNRIEPFYQASVFYVVAFLLACASWLTRSSALRRGAYTLILVTLLLHTFGLFTRMYLQGRPPVTNLYSSAIFCGWGAVVLAVILERFFRDGVGSACAGAIGFSTLIIAHNLAGDGDTMTMMQAVLDTNFWLATHVVVVTLGYASTFLAGFIALFYVIAGMSTKMLTPERAKALNRMVYGIVCFATLFSFTGTVLGGIWADQSWGRFWGWDPKENGALLIVIWNAIILHCRWGGMIRERGLMVMAVFGNVVTSISWFGTNMLGIGLHSYGFMDKAFFWLMLFIGSQLLFMLMGGLPLRLWTSFKSSEKV